MQEHHLSVTRTARYHTLGSPDAGVEECWFVCHGYGQLARRFLRHFEPLATTTRLIVAPEALSRFYLDAGDRAGHAAARVGATWMTREDRLAEINDYVSYLDALHAQVMAAAPQAAGRTVVLGFSQGCATATRWLLQGRAAARHLVLWAGALPHDADPAALRDLAARTRITLVLGLRDELVDDARAAAELARLEEQGVVPEVVRFDGGHHLDADILRTVLQGP